VYTIGDVTSVGTPKAGVFAEGTTRFAAASIIAELDGNAKPPSYKGAGSCYVEFRRNRGGRVDVDFFRGLRIQADSWNLPLHLFANPMP
jgi:sulfide:quinone oxidoreductase